MVTTSESGHEKLENIVVPLSPRHSVQESLRTVIILVIIITIWALLRLYSRRVRYTPLNVEDALFYISVVAFYGMVVAFFLLLYLGGIGYHIDQLQKHHVARLTQSVLAIQGLYGLSMCTSKWSILWILKRVFATPNFAIFAWIIIAVQAAWMVMTLLIGLLVCRPIEKNWDPTAGEECGDQIAAYTAVSVVNVVVDVAMCLLPLPMIWGLHVKKPYKLALFGIFSIGIVSVIFAVLRLFSLRSIDFDDFSYTVPKVITWTYAETGVVILVACSPLLRPIFDKTFRGFLSGNKSSSNQVGPSYDSHALSNSASTNPKVGGKRKSGFMTMGESQESLELREMGHRRVESRAVAGKDPHGTGADHSYASSDKDAKMGIMVEREVSQTIDLV